MKLLTLLVLFYFIVEVLTDDRIVKPIRAPPQFDGYVVLAQFECDDLLCPDWSLEVTRLATECYTWNCTNEELQITTLVPKSPSATLNFPIFTAFHNRSRTFYTAGIINIPPASGRIWTTDIFGNVSAGNNGPTSTFYFPSERSVFVSLEVTSKNVLLIIFQDGDIESLNPTTGQTTFITNVLNNSTEFFLSQATTVDGDNLYLVFGSEFGANIGILTVSLTSFTVTNVTLSSSIDEIAPFQITYLPNLKTILLFSSTEQWDQLVYVDPTTGNASYAVFDLMSLNNFEFSNNPAAKVRSDDTYKNNAYDATTGMVYFQASQVSDEMDTTSLISVGPFLSGEPQTLEWVFINLQPLDFGYQGMHYVMCEGLCPT